MDETKYMISDAAKKLHIEAHVLRYWEDELEMDIPRTQLGHRYYTEAHLLLFERIRQLKEAGYQLKSIRLILPKLGSLDSEEVSFLSMVSEEMNRLAGELTEEGNESGTQKSGSTPKDNGAPVSFDAAPEAARSAAAFAVNSEGETPSSQESLPSNIIPMNRQTEPAGKEDKLRQFQALMVNAMGNALQLQAKQFGTLLADQVSEKLISQLDGLLRLRQEQEEARFHELDETIRNHQKVMQEAAASRNSRKRKRRR